LGLYQAPSSDTVEFNVTDRLMENRRRGEKEKDREKGNDLFYFIFFS
jgi:hypothetical protein